MSAAMQPRSLGLQPVRGLGRSLAAQPIGSAISSKSFKEHRTVCHAAMDASSGGMAISGGAWELRAPGEPGSKVVPAGPQLMNRSISTNPLETLGNAADALAHKAACLALPVVRSKPLSIAAAAAVGTLYALVGGMETGMRNMQAYKVACSLCMGAQTGVALVSAARECSLVPA